MRKCDFWSSYRVWSFHSFPFLSICIPHSSWCPFSNLYPPHSLPPSFLSSSLFLLLPSSLSPFLYPLAILCLPVLELMSIFSLPYLSLLPLTPPNQHTVVSNYMKSTHSFHIQKPLSHKPRSEWANEWAQRGALGKWGVRSKRANIGANGPGLYASISHSFYCIHCAHLRCVGWGLSIYIH